MSDTQPPSIDLNQIATELVSRATTGLIGAVSDHARSITAEFRVRLGRAFTQYLNNQLAKRSRVRTILYRENPQFIYDFYVPQDIQSGDAAPLNNIGALQLLRTSLHTILTGTGGSGKSFCFRHLFIDLIRYTDYVPLFVELKSVNEDGATFESILFRELDLASANLTPEVMLRAMKRGSFALLLDGFDEIVLEKQNQVAKAIRALAEESPNTPLLMSSRPDDRFIGWEGFQQFRLLPLTKDKVQSLIKRLKYEDSVKSRFAADVDKKLWKSHQSFLSNPLLLTIMLLTYSHNAAVPTRMHLFYAQVFETLWNRHDASKDGYQRLLESRLEKDLFLRVLEAFSFRCYWESKLTFNDAEAAQALTFAVKLCGCDCDTIAILKDLTKALCILNQDGLLYSFTHRSFQEYYAARFALSTSPDNRSKIIQRISESSVKDQVLTLMWEMDKNLVEREIVLPSLNAMHAAVNSENESLKIRSFINFWCQEIHLDESGVLGWISKPVTSMMSFIVTVYGGETWTSLMAKFDASTIQKDTQESLAKAVNNYITEHPSSLHKMIPIDVLSNEFIDALSRNRLAFSEDALNFFLRTRDQIVVEHAQSDRSLEELFASDMPRRSGRRPK